MRIFLMVMIVAPFLFFCLAGQATAVGFGGYIEGASGDGEFEYDYSPEFDVDSDSGGLGFVMDTNLNDERVFGYRLNVGFESLELEDDFGTALELDGLVIANTFGFALVTKPDLRWWIGPQVKVGFYSGEVDNDPATDYDLISFGVGGVTGVNFVTSKVCISTSLGVLISGYAGETDGPGIDRDVEIGTTTVFLNLAFLFGD